MSSLVLPRYFCLIKTNYMQITINDHRKIYAIQEEFNSLFPNLKIAFYVKSPNLKAPHPKKLIEAHGKTLAECRNIHNKGQLTITRNMTAADLESNFNEVYGLDVEIMKKNGEKWMELDSKNTLTLEEQNKNS